MYLELGLPRFGGCCTLGAGKHHFLWGDLNSVTIFDESASACIASALVSHHKALAMVSPVAPDLPAPLLYSDSHLSLTLHPGPVPTGCRAVPQSHSTE